MTLPRRPSTQRRWSRLTVAALAALPILLAGAGCDDADTPAQRRAQAQAKLSDEALIQGTLFGSREPCREPGDCVVGLCHYGACNGLMYVERPWMQHALAEQMDSLTQARPVPRAALTQQLTSILSRQDTDLAARARAVRGLEALGAKDPLAQALPTAPEAIAEAISLALCRLGDDRGLPHTAALTEDPARPIAIEALHALGDSALPDALAPLLRTLHPSLDQALVRGALEGLRRLGDRRAIGPLVAFLDAAPEPLAIRTERVLASLTGQHLGGDSAAWRAWLKDHPAPPAPPFEPRVFDPAEDIGLPAP